MDTEYAIKTLLVKSIQNRRKNRPHGEFLISHNLKKSWFRFANDNHGHSSYNHSAEHMMRESKILLGENIFLDCYNFQAISVHC